MEWGSQLFVDVVDHPEMVHDFLTLVTETYAVFKRTLEQVYPFQPYGNVHWGKLHKGTIMLRDDSGTNFLWKRGSLHRFIGRDAWFTHHPLSQPHLNDMPKVYQHTVDCGIKLIGLDFSAVEQAMQAGINLKEQVQC